MRGVMGAKCHNNTKVHICVHIVCVVSWVSRVIIIGRSIYAENASLKGAIANTNFLLANS